MKKFIYAVMLLLCLSIIGCQKESPNAEAERDGNAKLTRVVYEFASGGHNVMDLEYDNKGRLSRMKGGMLEGTDGDINLVYNDQNNTVSILSNLASYSETYQLNKEGLCTNDGYCTYSYFNGHLVELNVQYHQMHLFWEDDCLVNIDNTQITYTSFDNPFFTQSFDPWVMCDESTFMEPCYLGLCGLSCKKLIKTYGDYISFEYSFNESGRLKEGMIRKDGKVWVHVYYNYEDEPLIESRDEEIEQIPSSLRGEWIQTGELYDQDYYPFFDIGSFGIGKDIDVENGISVYKIGENSISYEYILDVDPETISFNGGVLYGVKKKYTLPHSSDSWIYKNNHFFHVDYAGEFTDLGTFSIINDNKFYGNLEYSPLDVTWVYERLTEIQYIQ